MLLARLSTGRKVLPRLGIRVVLLQCLPQRFNLCLVLSLDGVLSLLLLLLQPPLCFRHRHFPSLGNRYGDAHGEKQHQRGDHPRTAPTRQSRPFHHSAASRSDRPMVEESFQVVGQLSGAGVAVFGLLGQALQTDRFEAR